MKALLGLASVFGLVIAAGAVVADDGVSVQVDAPVGVSVDVNESTGVQVDIGSPGVPAQPAELAAPGTPSAELGPPAPGIEGEEPPQPLEETPMENFLGVFSKPLPTAVAAQFSETLEEGQGLIVDKIVPDTPAEKAGLKQHDILVLYDDTPLSTPEQLKELVLADKPARVVKLTILRAAKQQVLEVPLGRRALPVVAQAPPVGAPGIPGAVPPGTVIVPPPRPGVVVRLFGRDLVVVEDGRVQAPFADVRWGRGPRYIVPAPDPILGPEAEVIGPARDRSVIITTPDGVVFHVEITYTDPAGQLQQLQFDGTKREIRKQVDALPREIREDVKRSFERSGEAFGPGQSFNLRVQPLNDGPGRTVRLSMTRPVEEQGARFIEVDHTFPAGEPMRMEELVKVDVLAKELDDVSPAVRERVVASLKKVKVPESKVDVEVAQ